MKSTIVYISNLFLEHTRQTSSDQKLVVGRCVETARLRADDRAAGGLQGDQAVAKSGDLLPDRNSSPGGGS